MILTFAAILVLALILFTTGYLPLEISGLFVVVLLVFTGVVPQREAFGAFGNEGIILIGSLFVLTAALKKAGVIAVIESTILHLSRGKRSWAFAITLIFISFVSAFLSNTATIAAFIPVVIAVANRFGESPRPWLMPVAFATVLGGTCTLLGTSTNIIINSLLPTYGEHEFSLFTTSSVGIPILIVGILFLIAVSHKILGDEKPLKDLSLKDRYNLRDFTAEVSIQKDSPLCNVSIASSALFREVDVTVVGVFRKGYPSIVPQGNFLLREDDRLLVEGNIEKLTEITGKYNLEFVREVKGDEFSNGPQARPDTLQFHEVVVTGRSLLNYRTPAEVVLRPRYRISLIAINRQGATIRDRLSRVRIQIGDILLVQFLGHRDTALLEMLGLVPLNVLEPERYKAKRPWLALGIFASALLVGTLSGSSITIACLTGALAVVITGIIRANEVYEVIEWRVLVFMASILTLGRGMELSGAASALASFLFTHFSTLPPHYLVAAFFVVTVILTQPLSNQATAVLMIPLAINTAHTFHINTMPLIMAVTIAASCGFLTPLEPVYMLVYGPGRYKFVDFLRLGLVLNILVLVVAVLAIRMFWG